jgi:hypothetical protein
MVDPGLHCAAKLKITRYGRGHGHQLADHPTHAGVKHLFSLANRDQFMLGLRISELDCSGFGRKDTFLRGAAGRTSRPKMADIGQSACAESCRSIDHPLNFQVAGSRPTQAKMFSDARQRCCCRRYGSFFVRFHAFADLG